MALVHETGAGLANAESYASVAQATAYHAARGNAAWEVLSEAVQEQNLRKATDYMLEVYTAAWQGSRAVDGQALDWPRVNVVAFEIAVLDSIVPPAVTNACAVLALKANSGPLAPDLSRAVKRKKVGPLETEYADYSPQSKRYLSVDRMLAPYMVQSNSYSVRLERG